jgi:hypothetical protein
LSVDQLVKPRIAVAGVVSFGAAHIGPAQKLVNRLLRE